MRDVFVCFFFHKERVYRMAYIFSSRSNMKRSFDRMALVFAILTFATAISALEHQLQDFEGAELNRFLETCSNAVKTLIRLASVCDF